MASGNTLVTGDTNEVKVQPNTYCYLACWNTETCTGNTTYEKFS
jgi:hypothetical protein